MWARVGLKPCSPVTAGHSGPRPGKLFLPCSQPLTLQCSPPSFCFFCHKGYTDFAAAFRDGESLLVFSRAKARAE